VDEIEVKVRVEVDGNDGSKSIQPVRLMVSHDSNRAEGRQKRIWA
jgi:hypothetical protein